MEKKDFEEIADLVVEHDLIVISDEVYDKHDWNAPLLMQAPITAQMAAIEALKNGESEMKKMVREYDRRRRVIVKGLNKIGLYCFEPKKGY